MPNKEGGDLNVIESAGSIGQISQFTNSYIEKKDNSAMPPIYQPKPERDIISIISLKSNLCYIIHSNNQRKISKRSCI